MILIGQLRCHGEELIAGLGAAVAAGQSVTRLQSLLGYDARIVRVMPNINAMALQAISGYTHSGNVSEDELAVAVKILTSFGEAVSVKEEDFSAFSAIAGCSPAYAYTLLDAAARVGVKYGLTKKESLEIVTDTVISYLKEDDVSSSGKLDEIVFSDIQKAYLKDKGM